MPRLLKRAIPLTGRTTVVPLNAAPVALDARPIVILPVNAVLMLPRVSRATTSTGGVMTDRKSTRLNSSHQITSYAVSCLQKTTDFWSVDRLFCELLRL